MAYKTQQQQAMLGSILGFMAVNVGLIFVSGWWIFALPISGFLGLIVGAIIGACKRTKTTRGLEFETAIVTAGDEKKPCTLIICPDRVIAESDSTVSIPLAAIKGLLFQQMTILTGFGIDYTDSGGKARLMFVNEGEFQAGRTRKILKAVQDAMMAIPMDAPEVTDISRAIKVAKNSVVHRM